MYLETLHRETFKSNLNLEVIYLPTNKLMMLHHQTFSHLKKLNYLYLGVNICINKDYGSNAMNQFPTIENDLRTCSTSYETNNRVDRKVESLQKSIDILKEENLEKFNEISHTIDKKVELLVQLYNFLDERNEENSKKIAEIGRTVDKIFDMLNRK